MRKNKVIRIAIVVIACSMLLSTFGAFPIVVYAATFNIGDTIEVTENLNARTGPGTTYPEITDPEYIGYAPAGTRGKVLDEPSSANGYIWWKVDYGPGLYSGWSVEGGLQKVSAPPSPTLSFTSLTPPAITTSQSTYDAMLSAVGTNFNNVNRVTFSWSGPDSGTDTWDRGGSR